MSMTIYLNEFLESNPLANYNFIDIVKYELKKTYDETWEFVKDCYLPLVGYALIMIEDDCISFSQSLELGKIQDFRRKRGGCHIKI